MRFYTKEYYTLMMSLGTADLYEPIIDRDYTDEEIEELYQKALDKYIEEERADYDEPPVLYVEEDGTPDEEDLEMFEAELEEYENREPFDEEETAEEFEEIYKDNLEEPDEDLPVWVRESVDPRILAMYFMPEKTYRKLLAEDEANEVRFDALEEHAEEKFEDMMEDLPEEFEELMDILTEQENADVVGFEAAGGEIVLELEGWNEDGDEAVFKFSFDEVDVLENEDVDVHSGKDEDGDTETDCELLYSEIYAEDDKAEIHMLFDNNGLKYLTFRCTEAHVYMSSNEE